METSQELFKALGMTLIHSIWQGAIIAACVMLILVFTGRNNARARYTVHFSGLLALLVSFIVTFVIVMRNNQALNEFQQAVLTLPQGNDLLKALPVSGKGIFALILDFFEPFSTWFALFWLTGFVITGIKMTGGAITARMMFRRDLRLPDEHLTELFNKLKDIMRIGPTVKLKISAGTISPMVTGILAPMVIIPASAVTGMSCDQIRAVLIHELAHIRRYDTIFVVIQAFARLMLFFHPLAWYLLREIDRERENCCDDYVILNNSNPINYIKALAMIQEMNLPGNTAISLAGRKNQLLSRIKRLIKPHTGYTAAFRLSVITLAVLIVGAILMAFIITEQPDLKRTVQDKKAGINPSPRQDVTASVIQSGKDGDKKKMVIIFNNDTIKEITVDGKKLSREEMKEYAEDIRKVQRELETSQDELKRAHTELEIAHRQLELAQKEMQMNHLDLNEQLNKELALKNFNYEFYHDQWETQEFRDKMKKMQEEAWNAIKNGQNSLEYLNSEEFKEQMKKAQEELKLALEKNKELFNSEEFKKQMREASEKARKAFEELKKNSELYNEFRYQFRFDDEHGIPPMPPNPGLNHQEPPAPRPDHDVRVPEVPEPPEMDREVPVDPHIEEQPEVQKGEIPNPAEAPEVDTEIDVDEQIETPEMQDTGRSNSDERAKELDTKLRELEQE